MKTLILTLLVLSSSSVFGEVEVNVVLGGWSIHIPQNYYVQETKHADGTKSKKKIQFNADHDMLGLSLKFGRYRVSAIRLKNSYYKDSIAISSSRYITDKISIGIMSGSGYSNTNAALLGDLMITPTIKYDHGPIFMGLIGNAAVIGLSVPIY